MAKYIDRFLLDYFYRNLKKGYKVEDLKIGIIRQVYLRSDVERVIAILREKTKKEQEEKAKLNKPQEPIMEVIEEIPPKKNFFKRLLGLD